MELDKVSRYATKFVNDDYSRARHFEGRLHSHIRRGLVALHLTSYVEIVGHAKSLDSIWSNTNN